MTPRKQHLPVESREQDDDDVLYIGHDDPLAWRSKSWRPCTRGNPQRIRHAVACAHDGCGNVELHVPLSAEETICDVYFEERRGKVQVRVVACCEARHWDAPDANGEYRLVPGCIYVAEQVQTVVDLDTGRPIPWATALQAAFRQRAQQQRAAAERASAAAAAAEAEAAGDDPHGLDLSDGDIVLDPSADGWF